ncbi:TIGR02206 family membrane protein [Metabacillus indicus]|uniref:YwaF family protein n=1 Tax=Metabacillus indicus TaxID=246786 RepID=UPI0013771EAE|nr:TIGR02206 family membrane protein [Metabacillus indicus]
MNSFFSTAYDQNPFSLFSPAHLAGLGFLLLLLAGMYAMRHTLLQKEWNLGFRLLLAGTGVLFEAAYHIWLLWNGTWKAAYTLPLELCSMSLFLCIILLITKNRRIFEIVYFIGIAGAGLALLTPELNYSFPHLRYFHFFLTHSVIMMTCFFFVWTEGYQVTFKSVFKTMGFLNIAAVCIFFVNRALGGNYMFLSQKPVNPTPIDFLGPYPWYLLSLEAVAFCLFVLLVLPFYTEKMKDSKAERSM